MMSLALFSLYCGGFISAFHAILRARTPQAAIAWAMSLWVLAPLSLPFYWIFGRNRFPGYVEARRKEDSALRPFADRLEQHCRSDLQVDLTNQRVSRQVLEKLAKMPFTHFNKATLLINGEATFQQIFASLPKAKSYILVQFYQVADDELGHQLKNLLLAQAKRGISIYFLYDEIGCFRLSSHYLEELASAGVEVAGFQNLKHIRNPFRLNFRNHRKVVIVDGEEAYIGGHNVSDTYLGKNPKMSPWRDTHLHLVGPSVLAAQLSFLEDWFWATGRIPDWHWEAQVDDQLSQEILILPTGPADPWQHCELLFCHMINSAQNRVWIATPYFIPSPEVMSALKLARLRGVEVRVLIPAIADHFMILYSNRYYIHLLEQHGIEFSRYKAGFLHQKIMIVDEDVAMIGTANFDNRSFRLNFEITALVADDTFNKQVEAMLIEDFSQSEPVPVGEYVNGSLWYRLCVRFFYLLSPIQ